MPLLDVDMATQGIEQSQHTTDHLLTYHFAAHLAFTPAFNSPQPPTRPNRRRRRRTIARFHTCK
jgi:hypothetical protein